jgi:hypothetical protein
MCVDNVGDEISLDVGKVYQIVKPRRNDPVSMLRVIDNEGEDYLYSKTQFVSVQLPLKARKAVAASVA